MIAILISIQPKHVANILNGIKKLEIRKSMPKCDLPIDVYIYCTKGNKKDWHLIEVVDTDTGWEGYEYDYYIGSKGYLKHCLEGKIVAKFTLKEVEPAYNYYAEALCGVACLSKDELYKYAGNWTKVDDLFAWHIDNLEIFDEPKELSEFRTLLKGNKLDHSIEAINYFGGLPLTKAPQSWQYVEVEK